MLFGVFTVRVPAEGWKPAGYVPAAQTGKLVTTHGVTATEAIKTPQFWLLWGVLFFNVTAGIGLLSVASPMIQDLFPGRVTKEAAAGFVGLLSLFNLAGRFGWSSLSDKIGRKPTYLIYFLLGGLLYVFVPIAAHLGSVALFVGSAALILSMYGGGFATIPAYLRDLFGTLQVGAIHGRLLTAWSAAGVAGPYLFATPGRVRQVAPPAARAVLHAGPARHGRPARRWAWSATCSSRRSSRSTTRRKTGGALCRARSRRRLRKRNQWPKSTPHAADETPGSPVLFSDSAPALARGRPAPGLGYH